MTYGESYFATKSRQVCPVPKETSPAWRLLVFAIVVIPFVLALLLLSIPLAAIAAMLDGKRD